MPRRAPNLRPRHRRIVRNATIAAVVAIAPRRNRAQIWAVSGRKNCRKCYLFRYTPYSEPVLRGSRMATASLQSRGYLPIATASLRPAAVLDCDLFIQRKGCAYAELYRGSTYPLEVNDIEQLRADGVDHLYIRAEDASAYRDYLCTHVLHDKTIPPAARMQALREVTRVAFQDALTASDCDRMVSVASEYGGDLASVVAEKSIAFRELFTT